MCLLGSVVVNDFIVNDFVVNDGKNNKTTACYIRYFFFRFTNNRYTNIVQAGKER